MSRAAAATAAANQPAESAGQQQHHGQCRTQPAPASLVARPRRRTQMACLDDIPKYAFGTSHTIVGQSAAAAAADSRLPQLSEPEFVELVMAALDEGCRHFDCAPLYRTQRLVGNCLRAASRQVPRQRLFLTSKLPPNMMRSKELISRSITKSIDELQCCYLDLFLIHAPFATKHLADDQFYPLDENGQLLMDETELILENAWRTLAELKQRGLTRYIGLSNVNMEQLVRLHSIHPVDVVQNEYHIYNQNRDLFDFCEEIDVHFEGYACFGNPPKCKQDGRPCCMSDPVVRRVARRNSLSVAQTIIQWINNQPLSYVIKCDNVQQLKENLAATKFVGLPVEDLIELDSLDRGCRVHTFAEHKGLVGHREYPFKSGAGRQPPEISSSLDDNSDRLENANELARHDSASGTSDDDDDDDGDESSATDGLDKSEASVIVVNKGASLPGVVSDCNAQNASPLHSKLGADCLVDEPMPGRVDD
jgi:diketogulonate reductase-like aldo/keto reductase